MLNSLSLVGSYPLHISQSSNTKKIINTQNRIQGSDITDFKFHKCNNVSFTGKQYPSGSYEDNEIADAKKSLHYSGSELDSWKKVLYDEKYKEAKRALIAEYVAENPKPPVFDSTGDGLYVYPVARSMAKTYIKRINNLRIDILSEQNNEKIEESKILTKEAERRAEYIQQTFEVKEMHLKPKLIDLLQLDKEGKDVPIPNCVMLVGPSPEVTNELIEWTGKNANCNFVKIENTDDLLEHLEEAEKTYNKTGNRTLIYVENFDQLLNHQLTPDHIIEGLKGLMCCTSEDYHSTLIFSTKDPSNLDQIALQPHRISEKINVNIKSPISIQVEDACSINRLGDIKRAETLPIATINDLLAACWGQTNVDKLKLDYTPEDLTRAEEAIIKVLSPHQDHNQHYFKVLKIAIERLK